MDPSLTPYEQLVANFDSQQETAIPEEATSLLDTVKQLDGKEKHEK